MKSISSGLCLVAMLLVSMVAAGTASAAPVWEHCELGGTATRYETGQCLVAHSGGNFSWQEVKGTEAIRSHGSLTLKDTVLGTTVEVLCSGENEGSVGPGKFDRITAITKIKCVAGKNCTKLNKEAEPVNLPWQTELEERAGGEVRDHITNGGRGEPGWRVGCTVPILGERTDECKTEMGTVVLHNTRTVGASGAELLVLSDFEPPTAEEKAKCSVSGEKTGEVLGSIALLQFNGDALRVS